MSGVGKTTVLDELRRRSYLAIDTDYDGWELPDGTWAEPRMHQLLLTHAELVVSGTVPNQVRFYDRFEYVVLFSAPLGVLLDRVTRRENNPYGKTVEQQKDIQRNPAEVEPLMRRGASMELDGRRTVTDFADSVETLIRPA